MIEALFLALGLGITLFVLTFIVVEIANTISWYKMFGEIRGPFYRRAHTTTIRRK
jgi:hypothetical protein